MKCFYAMDTLPYTLTFISFLVLTSFIAKKQKDLPSGKVYLSYLQFSLIVQPISSTIFYDIIPNENMLNSVVENRSRVSSLRTQRYRCICLQNASSICPVNNFI